MYNDIAYLCTETITHDEYLNEIQTYAKKMVFVQRKSVTSAEFYRAATTDFKPARVLKLADRYDYSGEAIVQYEGTYFDVIRTYESGNAIELVLQERIGREGDDEESE